MEKCAQGTCHFEINKAAPDFTGIAVINREFKEISLNQFRGKYVVLFFYPMDFTFVCPTEITGFSDMYNDFQKINCEIIGASCDSHFCHLAWMNLSRKEGGLGDINFPLLSDKSMAIAEAYGILDKATGIPFRGLFIINGKGILKAGTVHDLAVGRNAEEVLRLVQAFQHVEKYGEVCPMGWKPGGKSIKPNPVGALDYFKSV